MQRGYQAAIDLAGRVLSARDPGEICARTGAVQKGGEYFVPWFGEDRAVLSGNPIEQVLWLHYLTSEGTHPPTGRLIAYREVPGAGFYAVKFEARAVKPLVKHFGLKPEDLCKAGMALGGRPYPAGDGAVTIRPLPRLPVTYIVWKGDDELDAAGSILFDETAIGWLPAEDLAVLACLGTYRLIRAYE